MKKIKVAYVRTQFWFGLKFGGSVSHTIGVLKGLNENNCDIKIFSNENFLGIEDFKYDVIKPRFFNKRLIELGEILYNFYASRDYERKIRDFKPDFIYHRFSGRTYFVCRIAKKLKIPIVLEVNGLGNWLSKFDFYKKSFLKGIFERWIKRRALFLIEKYNFRNSSIFVVISKALENSLLKKNIPPETILVIPNAVDSDKFAASIVNNLESKIIREKLGLKDNNIVAGFIGTFGPWHGVETLASAICRINEDKKDNNIVFLLVGEGVLKVYAEQKTGHFNNVIFTGAIPYTEIQNYLSVCDILVSPHSLHMDGKEFIGSPTKIFEYMAMGKGIVASRLGQLGEILEDGKTALLLEPDDIEGLANSILRLARDKDFTEELGRNAAKIAQSKYTWGNNIKILLDYLYMVKILK